MSQDGPDQSISVEHIQVHIQEHIQEHNVVCVHADHPRTPRATAAIGYSLNATQYFQSW